jgi:predicted transcriptional regulator
MLEKKKKELRELINKSGYSKTFISKNIGLSTPRVTALLKNSKKLENLEKLEVKIRAFLKSRGQ